MADSAPQSTELTGALPEAERQPRHQETESAAWYAALGVIAFGTALRAELKMFGVDVCLINPGPYATGFNDRMANDPGPWFDRKKVAPEDVAVMDQLVQRITVGQMNPAEVVKRYVELVDDLPRTDTQKVRKAALRARWRAPGTWDAGLAAYLPEEP